MKPNKPTLAQVSRIFQQASLNHGRIYPAPEQIIFVDDIDKARERGEKTGRECHVSHRTDNYGNLRNPEKSLTSHLARNPYRRIGCGKKLNAAWHNGFLSTVRDDRLTAAEAIRGN